MNAESFASKTVRSAADNGAYGPLAANPSSVFFNFPSDAPQTVTLVISNPPLTAVVADPSIAAVSFDNGHTVHTSGGTNDRYVTLTITPLSYGYTTITVTDKHTGSISIPVQVGGGHGMD